MSDFTTALDSVRGTLVELRAAGCRLSATREALDRLVSAAPAEGKAPAGLVFVGEEAKGEAGKLLGKIIDTMGLTRDLVQVVPVSEGRAEIMRLQPRVIVALGEGAMEALAGTAQPMGKIRGRWHAFEGTPLLATYPPSHLLQNQSLAEKRKVWEDMLLVMERLDLPISERQRNFFR